MFVVLVVLVAPWAQMPTDNADSAGMLAHLHAFFEDQDLLYDDEYAELGMSPLFAFVTPRSAGGRGVVSNHWPFGATFLQAPGWLLGRGASELLLATGKVRDGPVARWTIPLLGLSAWAQLVLVGLGVAIWRWLRRRQLGRSLTLTFVLFALFGTPIAYYAIEAPMRPHLWGTVVVSMLVMRWYDAVELAHLDPERARGVARGAPKGLEGGLGRALILASLAGLAAAIRPQLAPFCLLVAHERWLATRRLPGAERWRLLVSHGLATAAVWALWASLVPRVQWWMYGGVGDYAGEVSHHLWAFLFSTHHGVFTWCPVLVLGLFGLGVGVVRREHGAGLLLVLLAMQVWLDAGTREITPYTVLGTRTWTGGTAFGPRKLVDALPLLIPSVLWIQSFIDGIHERHDEDSDAGAARAVRLRWMIAAGGGLACLVTTSLAGAAWIDSAVTSTVLDPERYLIALTLPYDPGAWADAWAMREVPLAIVGAVSLVVSVPLVAVALAVAKRVGMGGRSGERPPRLPPARIPKLAVVAAALAPVLAHFWLSILWLNSEAELADHPDRMKAAAQVMNPWHEATVRAIPAHQRLLEARLGDGV